LCAYHKMEGSQELCSHKTSLLFEEVKPSMLNALNISPSETLNF